MMRAGMTRRISILALALALIGCGDENDLPENPPYAVPGLAVTQPAPGQPMPGVLAMGGAPPTFDPALAVPGQPSPIPPPPPPPMPPGMQPGQMPPGMQPDQVPPGMQPGQVPPGMQPGQMQMQPGQMQPAAPLTLATGFVPDPAIARGMASAMMPVSALSPIMSPLSPDATCTGHVPSQPAHVMTLTSSFTNLRILVSSAEDIVLVVRQPDGTFRCDDDTDPGVIKNPTMEGAFSPGTYTIWVGMWDPATPPAPYVIGFTELPHVTHATLGS